MAITYRPSSDIAKEIERLKSSLNINTSTKLIDHLVAQYQTQQDEIKKLKAENYKKSDELYDCKDKVSVFVDAFNELSALTK
ncbi:hypothetical protein [Pseudoalteromonas sp. Of7M-16]|uniref:hypothetical protein n=1 Tax=Pseudoalteromonas sp. Of7M-16 TaxID=2917756 RepID=UPI001EF40F27|nr:hypothetical protein [Pseudoalteromonas sp. Of7M-16]MCG7546950.1 hypothetical protein [Pseudoalteromonas sp. Of7M-16]